MNIFFLHEDTEKCARLHNDKHVVKMILETAQLLCTTAHELGFEDVPYKAVHRNHPCSIWARTNRRREALTLPNGKEWLLCWQKELDALLKYRIGDLVAAPRHHKVLKSRIVFKIKYCPDGSILKYKARFVACGYSQSYGIDYLETFAPVVQLPALRLMLALCVHLSLETFHIDFENAFLQADLSETIYVMLPEGAEQFDKDGKPLVVKLRKSLYGLKQAPFNWNAKLVSWLIKEGFEQSTADTSVFIYNKTGIYCVLCTYVDDVPLGYTLFIYKMK